MKVTMLTPSVSRSAGGIFEIERQLSQALQVLGGVSIEVLGLEDRYAAEDMAEWQPLRPCLFQTVGPRSFGYAPKLVRALEGLEADLLHLHVLWMYTSVVAYRWARRMKRPHIVTINGMLDQWALQNAAWKKRIAGWLYENNNLRSAACIQVNTQQELQAVRDYGLSNPVCVIPNGVELKQNHTATAAPWHEEINAGAKVLLFLGRIHPKKGLSELLDAFSRVYQDPVAHDWHLAIIGWDDGDHEARLRRRARQLGLDTRVHWLGPRFGAEKAAALAHADAFILPSHSEGLPMAVLEAWSYYLPVLMTAACNLPEGFAKGAAFEITSHPEALAHVLSEFFAMPESVRTAMGGRGRALVEARFTWPQVAAEMHAVYRWVLGRGDRPACVQVD